MGQIFFLTLFSGLLIAMPVSAASNRFTKNASAIYGSDDREFVSAKSSTKIKELSASIAMIVARDAVVKNIFSSKLLADLLTDSEGLNLCEDEKFATHHSVDSCSGFLVGENLLATAGHCFRDQNDCDNKLILFNVLAKNEVDRGHRLMNKNIYECAEVLSSVLDSDSSEDYAIIRLKKKVIGRKSLKMRTAGTIRRSDEVFMIGHPLGLPQVVTNSASVNEISNTHYFKATLDSFEGNSGSPVFNSKTFEVEGILVRGEEDFLQDQSLQCYREQVYDPGTAQLPGTKGEGVTRISDILPLLKNF